MPITTPSKALTPLSSKWTHKDVLTYVRTLTSQLDSTNIQNYTIRTFINSSISQIAEMLRYANEAQYSFVWEGTIEGSNLANMQWLDLSTPVANPSVTPNTAQRTFETPTGVTNGSFIPVNLIANIDRVAGVMSTAQISGNVNALVGPCKKANIADLIALVGNHNESYRQSILWSWHADKLFLFHGQEIDQTPTGALATGKYYKRPGVYTVWGTRLPMLDDLVGRDFSDTYDQLIDIPDRHVRLLVLMVQKQVLEALNRQMDQASAAELTTLTQQITQNVIQQPQVEAVKNESERTSTGL